MTTLREAAQQALEALIHMCHNTVAQKGYDGQRVQNAIDGLEAALAQEPVAYTGDVARRMREAGMTFHLGMPRAVVIAQMTRFHDLVCAEASIKAAAAFAAPPRREWVSLTEEEIRELSFHNQQTLWPRPDRSDVRATAIPFARAIEAALKERNT